MLHSNFEKHIDMKEVKKGTNKEAMDAFKKELEEYIRVHRAARVTISEDSQEIIEYREEEKDEMFDD